MKTYASAQLLYCMFPHTAIGITGIILYITIVYALVFFILPRSPLMSKAYNAGIGVLFANRSINATYSLIHIKIKQSEV